MVYSYNREFTLHLCDFSVRDPSLWKTDGKYRASLRMILCSNRPSLPDDNHPAESQPDPISRPVCAFSAVKPFKYVRQSFFFKSRAAVMNRNFSEQNRIRTDNRNRSVIPRAFHTVFKDVLYCLRQPARVALNDYGNAVFASACTSLCTTIPCSSIGISSGRRAALMRSFTSTGSR